MLHRILNLTRRQKLQAFPPRQRTMAATCFGQSGSEDAGLATFVVDDVTPGAPLLALPEQAHRGEPRSPRQDVVSVEAAPAAGASAPGTEAGDAPAGKPVEPARLALGQMRLKIENGLLMVFGPEGDPVPSHAFAAAAAGHPGAPLALPDGTMTSASRVAAVLDAQALARLGTPERCSAWMSAMLSEGGAPKAASEGQLRTDRDALTPAGAGEGGLTAVSDAGIAGVPLERVSERDDPAAEAEAAPATPQDDAPAPRGAFGRASPDRAPLGSAGALPAATCMEAGREALPGIERDRAAPAPADAGRLDLDVRADRLDVDRLVPEHGPRQVDAQAAAARQPEVDPDSMVLVVIRGVPEGARLSTGVRDDDGSWLISPLDLSTVTITLASPSALESGPADGDLPGADVDLSITGIALTEDGELVAICESVPLADYLGESGAGDVGLGDVGLGDSGSGEPEAGEPGAGHLGAGKSGPAQDGGAGARDNASAPGPRMIPLELRPQAWGGGAFDALVIRDLPAGARLSAGAYDTAIDGWVLRPQDLRSLAILPPPDLRADFTVTLLGIALRSNDADAARVLARFSVRLA